LKKKKFLKTQ